MRLRQRDLRIVYWKKQTMIEDDEGIKTTAYTSPTAVQAKIQPAGGKMMLEEYGLRIDYMLTMYCENTNIVENDGICVYVASTETPDYHVIAKRLWDIPVYILEKLVK